MGRDIFRENILRYFAVLIIFGNICALFNHLLIFAAVEFIPLHEIAANLLRSCH